MRLMLPSAQGASALSSGMALNVGVATPVKSPVPPSRVAFAVGLTSNWTSELPTPEVDIFCRVPAKMETVDIKKI